MPYALRKRCGVLVNVMPEATNFLGPVLESSPGGPATQLRRQISLTSKLVSELPKVHWFSQVFHADVDNVMAFQEAGYTATVRHSVIVDASSKEIAWRNMRDKTRNSIRQSERTDQVVEIHDPHEFIATYKSNLYKSRLKSYVDFVIVRSLLQESIRRRQGRIIGLRDPRGNLHSAIFYIWDHQTAYYSLSTRSISQSSHGAISHLIWAAIQDTIANNRRFDFDGVVRMGAGRLYSGFGGRVVSRLGVEKGSDLYTLSNSLLRFLAGRGRRQMA